MATNRKSESAAVRLGPAVKAFLLCALIAVSGVGFVWQKSQLQKLGREITASEGVLNDLRRQNRAMRERLDALCRPSALDARVRSLGLGLGPPLVTHVIRLTELPVRESAADQGGFAVQTAP